MLAELLHLSEWSRREEAARQAGLARVDRVKDKTPELQAILAEHGVGVAYLFGSMSSGLARPGSDVDIAVGGCPVARFYQLAAKLERALGLPLDLVDLDRAPHDFAEHVRRTGQCIHPRGTAGKGGR